MEYRQLGRTGIEVSALGFGCGSVGGLLVRGERHEMVRAVARAIELGIAYFDTASSYGDGRSETNLGHALRELRADVVVGTKVRLRAEEMVDIEGAIAASVEASLCRLGLEQVDLIQLHNPIALERQPERGWVGVRDLEDAARAFERLQTRGLARHWGINGLGETEALHQAIAPGRADTIQCCYNLINPTAGAPAPEGFPHQDYGRLIDSAAAHDMGVIAIRVLAAGALSGSGIRHPNAAQSVAPIGTGRTFAEDVALAQRFAFLVDEGHASSLVEAAVRFAIGKPGVSTVLVGISSVDQLEQAVRFASRGPLAAGAVERLGRVWAGYQDPA